MKENISDNDGIYKINLISSDISRIISFKDIPISQAPLNDDVQHWFDHLMYNPSGDRFSFFHSWGNSDSANSSVYTADSFDGGNLFKYPDVKFYSHYSWKNNDQLSLWSYPAEQDQSAITKTTNILRKVDIVKTIAKIIFSRTKSVLPMPVLSKITKSSKLILFTDKTEENSILGNNILFGNGHQTWFKDQHRLLNDTYQDADNYRSNDL